MSTSSGNFEKAFYHDGYQLGMKACKDQSSDENLSAALAEMYRNIDELTDNLFVYARQQGKSIECKKGCHWCCHQPVFAMDYELKYLRNFIAGNFALQEQTAIKRRAGEKNERLKPLKGNDLLNAKHPCPLLMNGACMAYEARPVACRIYLSSSVNSCQKFYKSPDDKNNYPALLDFPMRLGRMMNEGFKAALKANGIIAREFRIEEKLM
ncbi:YkgJ family cysteine cluster protein [Maribellus sp. YY47]|uniref:YkgJ family cysteine cluster protein n=1 Tax=Maribellus sp. YY47 TaxID=2929486 RepID=UPI002000D2F4|nr:YkgJ family cysteine cluster protein [Maribellus sp. YY47]